MRRSLQTLQVRDVVERDDQALFAAGALNVTAHRLSGA